MDNIDRLCLNQVTVLAQWSLGEFLDGVRRHGIPTVSIWRDKLLEAGSAAGARAVRSAGLEISSLCAAGLITTPSEDEAPAAIDELKRAIDDTAAVGAGCLMFVAGGADPRDKNLERTRARVLDRLRIVAPHARAAGVKIALEPLHPMTCGTRSVLSTLGLANDWCDALAADDVFGIAVDTYAVWWDPALARELARAGRRIIAYHLSDWRAETRDMRLDRGMPGDGLIDFPGITDMVRQAGYQGPLEVEVFSALDWWKRDPDEVIEVVKARVGDIARARSKAHAAG